MDVVIKNILSKMKNILDERIIKYNISDDFISYIFFMYVYNAYFKLNDYRVINLVIEQFENRNHRMFLDNSFWYGKAGIGYALSIIDKKYYKDKIEEYKKSVEAYLNLLSNCSDIFKFGYRTYDLFSGMCGCFLFLLQIDQTNNIYIEKSLDNLIYNINISDEKFNRFRIKREITRNIFIKSICYDDYVDLGKAHGLAGILKILKICKNRGYNNKGINEAISKLEKFYFRNKNKSSLTLWNRIYPSKNYLEINNSWCYGNLGIITSLYNKENCEDIKIAKDICLKRILSDDIINYFFCHGISGEIFMINQLDNNFSKNELIKNFYDNLIIKVNNLNFENAPEEFALDNIFSILDGFLSIIVVYLILYCEFDKSFLERMFLIETG